MLNDKTILAKSSGRDLGVIFSTDLSWSKHIHHILSKAYNQLHFIQRTFKVASTPTSVKKKLYLSLILPILTYASQVYRPSHIKDIKALELFQKRATKYILHNSSSNYKSQLTKLNLLPLIYRLEFYMTLCSSCPVGISPENTSTSKTSSLLLPQVSPPGLTPHSN